MTPEKYLDLKEFVIDQGYAHEVYYYQDIPECNTAVTFAFEAIWAICNSGMKNQVARKIYNRVLTAMIDKKPLIDVFKHKGKVKAIESIWENRAVCFARYLAQEDNEHSLIELEKLPWIGKVTKYHLAKNLGMDVCKPDRHLVRIAEKYNTTPEKLCQKLSDATGDRIATVDYVIWRAANLGKI